MPTPSSIRTTIAAVVLLTAAAVPARAQQQDTAARAEVVAVVEKLFDAMRAQDTVALRSVFDPAGRLVNASGRNGMSVTTVDQFVHSIGRAAGVELIERIFAPEVRIDGDLATVWTFYTFHRGDEFSHCGYDAFQLLRLAGAWKIVNIADTRRTENCDRRPGAW